MGKTKQKMISAGLRSKLMNLDCSKLATLSYRFKNKTAKFISSGKAPTIGYLALQGKIEQKENTRSLESLLSWNLLLLFSPYS